ncbi:MAG: hypothetical protein HND48_03385 [Chloroflexi bacterium]|nr:hypothetical protein [Chloroflexota bacterium]
MPPSLVLANIFLQPDTLMELFDVYTRIEGEERLTFELYPEGDVYVNAGSFQNGGVAMQFQQSTGVTFDAKTECLAAKQIPGDVSIPGDNDKVALTCFTGQRGDCVFHLPNQEPEEMNPGERVLIDLVDEQVISRGPTVYEEVKLYYDSVVLLTGSDALVTCLGGALDVDGDTVPYPVDQCETEPGSPETMGCPDPDNDLVASLDDLCPDEAGPPENQGCPLSTATPIPDIDGDDINDVEDSCPFEPGPPENQGCPEGTTSRPTLRPSSPVLRLRSAGQR